jgi:hypothetical protein
MIVEWIIYIATGFGEWVAGLFPTLDIPAELVNLDDSVNQLFMYGEGLGAFIPWGVVGTLAAIPLLVWVAGLTIKTIRALVAHIPFVGGRG